jgi:SAM-dependent methyltransferase
VADSPDAPFIAANQAQWDERAALHLESTFYDVDGWLRNERGPKSWEVQALGDVTGLRLLHLQCHFGLDTLAWARAGATVTGLDFSPVAIAAAADIAERAGLSGRASFVCAGIDEAIAALNGARFHVTCTTIGSLCWLPSIERWAEVVAATLVSGGRLYLHDVHPVAWSMAEEDFRLTETYFEEAEPWVDDSPGTYTDANRPRQVQRSYEWNHSLGEIITALIRHGLRITALTEHDWTLWSRWPWLIPGAEGKWSVPTDMPRVPLSFTLLAERT